MKRHGIYIQKNDVFSIIALLLSLGSFMFTWFVYSQSNKENISIISVPDPANYHTTIDTSISISPILKTQWIVILSNIGEKSLSVVKYELWQINPSQGMSTYSNIDQGIFDENNVRVSLPIDIEPGKSRKIIMKTGLAIDKNASQILKKIHFKDGPISISALKDSLLRYHTDIFGNKVEPVFDKSNLVGETWNSNKEIINNIKITTAKGASFNQNMEWYPIFDKL